MATQAASAACTLVRRVTLDLARKDSGNRLSSTSRAQGETDEDRQAKQRHRLANKRLIESMLEDQQRYSRISPRLSNVRPESPQGRALALVRHKLFGLVAASLVTLNAFYMGAEVTFRRCQEDSALDGWYVAQCLFVICFLAELSIRLFAERFAFFFDKWNSFDAFLVVVSVADTFGLRLFMGGGGKLDMLIALRCLRLARLARILRLLRFFKELWFLVEGIIAAAGTLVWGWLLTFGMLYVGAVFATNLIGRSGGQSSEARELFSNIPRSIYSLFQVLSVEGWVGIARTALEQQPWTALFFVLFLSATSFSIMHVVVAIIVQNTLTHASNRNEEEASAKAMKEKEALMKVHQIFEFADDDGNGEVTREEFRRALENPEVVGNLDKVNVDVRQAENLFDILDYDESGSLDAGEFVEGVMTARGEAESKDLLAVQCDLWKSEQRIQRKLSAFSGELRSQFGGDLHCSLQDLLFELRHTMREADSPAS